MLSDYERETLRDIENRLLAEEPGWDLAFARAGQQVSRQRVLEWTVHMLGLVLAGALTVLMLAANAPGPALFFAVVTGLLFRRMRRLRRLGRPGPAGPEVGHPGASSTEA